MLSEAGACSQEQNTVGGGGFWLVCPGKASPRSRRVGHAEIWLRTCQAEESAKMVKRKEAWRVWGPAEARADEGGVKRENRGEACWIIIRMWDLLWVESYRQSLSLGITWPAYVPTWSLWQLVENRVNGREEGAHCNNPDQRWGWPGPRWYPNRWWEVAKFQKFWKYRIWGKERSQGQLQGLGFF